MKNICIQFKHTSPWRKQSKNGSRCKWCKVCWCYRTHTYSASSSDARSGQISIQTFRSVLIHDAICSCGHSEDHMGTKTKPTKKIKQREIVRMQGMPPYTSLWSQKVKSCFPCTKTYNIPQIYTKTRSTTKRTHINYRQLLCMNSMLYLGYIYIWY